VLCVLDQRRLWWQASQHSIEFPQVRTHTGAQRVGDGPYLLSK
jgi:hypothetical protein